MSFQKAHNISNELAEVVVHSEEATLNGISGSTIELKLFQPIFKSYRVLEVGLVITDATASTATANVEISLASTMFLCPISSSRLLHCLLSCADTHSTSGLKEARGHDRRRAEGGAVRSR